MAQTSINIQPVKSGSERHNERLKEMEHIRKDLTHLNQSWKSPDFPRIDEQLAAIRADYQAAHGKRLHANATPVREAVVVIQDGTTIAQLRSACEECHRRYGIQAMQIYTHLDEGYAHAQEWTPNRHAHIVFNWYDFEKHATYKLNKYDMMEMQSIFARHLQMERGVSSDRKHLNAIQQKNAAEEKRLAELEAKVLEQSNTHEAAVRQTCKDFQHIGKQTLKNFDWLQQPFFADTVPATEKEQENRDRLAEEVQRDLREMRLQELMQEQSLLRVLIANTQAAITRIGNKLNKLATGIAFWKKKRIAHEGELQADKAAAERRATEAEKRASTAVEKAEAREAAAKRAEAAADQREAQAAAERRTLAADKDAARAEGRKAGATAKDQEWRKWYNEEGKPAIDERDKLREEKEGWQRERKSWLQDFRTIAKTLISRYPKAVADFEKAGLRDAVGTDIWDAAKQPEIKQSRGPHL